MANKRTNTRQFDDEDEEVVVVPPKRGSKASSYSMSQAEQDLYDCYGIRSATPMRIKIETLLLYRVDAESIAELLGLTLNDAEGKILEIEREWRELGQPLDDEDRELERGRLIAELRKLKNDVDQLIMTAPNKDNITMKAGLIDRIVKLRGLDSEKPATSDEISPTAKILSSIGDMTKADLTALYAVLNEEDDDLVESVASVEA